MMNRIQRSLQASLAWLWGVAGCCGLALGETVNFETKFGSFSMEMVSIGDPGNSPDRLNSVGNRLGAVPYSYRIGKTELPCSAADSFGVLNCLGDEDSPLLFPFRYWAILANRMNELHGYSHAYNFSPNGHIVIPWPEDAVGYDPSNPRRNSGARFVIPTADEWYKAAFYNAAEDDYYSYANGSDTMPVLSTVPTTQQEAVICCSRITEMSVFAAGGESPYGTVGQTGSANEWEESRNYFAGWGSEGRNPSSSLGIWRYNREFPKGGRLVFLYGPDDLRPGDANGDGKVGFQDFSLLSAAFGSTEASWSDGDFDDDGVVAFSDFLVLSDNYDRAFDEVSSVPEPGTHLILGIGVMLLLNCRRRREPAA